MLVKLVAVNILNAQKPPTKSEKGIVHFKTTP
jgi:hypothetical protein